MILRSLSHVEPQAVPCFPSPQGRGRARQADSSFVVLSEREDRPTTLLAEVEQLQSTIERDFQPVASQRSRAAQPRSNRTCPAVPC